MEDLPSDGEGLVTSKVRKGASMPLNCRFVRKERNASETGMRGLFNVIKGDSSAAKLVMTPITGTPHRCVISLGSRISSSR